MSTETDPEIDPRDQSLLVGLDMENLFFPYGFVDYRSFNAALTALDTSWRQHTQHITADFNERARTLIHTAKDELEALIHDKFRFLETVQDSINNCTKDSENFSAD
jgi:hypothetical protein